MRATVAIRTFICHPEEYDGILWPNFPNQTGISISLDKALEYTSTALVYAHFVTVSCLTSGNSGNPSWNWTVDTPEFNNIFRKPCKMYNLANNYIDEVINEVTNLPKGVVNAPSMVSIPSVAQEVMAKAYPWHRVALIALKRARCSPVGRFNIMHSGGLRNTSLDANIWKLFWDTLAVTLHNCGKNLTRQELVRVKYTDLSVDLSLSPDETSLETGVEVADFRHYGVIHGQIQYIQEEPIGSGVHHMSVPNLVAHPSLVLDANMPNNTDIRRDILEELIQRRLNAIKNLIDP